MDVPRGIRSRQHYRQISRCRAALAGGEPKARPPPFCYNRVQVCDLQKTFSTQPFMLSELPETVPEPL